ncbi:MAG: hypothetical protein V1720_14430, partial [bacterium]
KKGNFMGNPLDKPWTNKQRISFVLYMVFLLVSVWATGESIARSTQLPVLACYAIGLAALLGASFSLTLIKKSFSSKYVPNRSVLIVVGIVGFLFLWLVSLTSNTHNFYYVMTIDKLRQKELNTVKNELELVKDKSIFAFNTAKNEFSNKIESEIKSLKNEIMNPGLPGHGGRTDSIITTIETMLQSNIQRITPTGSDRRSLLQHADNMAEIIRGQTDNKLLLIDDRINELNKFIEQKEYNIYLTDLENIIKNYLTTDEMPLKIILRNGYSFYNKCYDFIGELFKIPFLKENIKLVISKLPEVPMSIENENIATSWRKFIDGKYDALDFYLALIWAITIDLACFILFYFGVLPKDED